MPHIRDRIIARHYATPHQYDVMVYTENNHYYAKDLRGNLICVDSPTACLQESVNYVARFGGGRILVRRGTYYPTNRVVIPDGINLLIEGEGNNTVFRYTARFTLFVHDPSSPTWTSTIIFRNFKIDRSGSGSVNIDIIHIRYAKFVMFDGIEVIDDWRNMDGDAALVADNSLIAVAQNNRVFNKSYGIWVGGLLSIARNNYVENTAKVGIGGAGLLPNFAIPSGYSPGGITVIESNICVDCGRTDEALAVDYGSGNSVIEAWGIIRNNLIVSRNYSMRMPIAVIYVSDAVVEGNKVYGSVSAPTIFMSSNKVIRSLVIRNNVFRVNPNSNYIRPLLFANVVTFENNVFSVDSSMNQNVSSQIDVIADRLVFRNNRITATYPSGYYTDYIINIVPLGNADFTTYIENNYFDVPVNPSLPSAVIIYPNTTTTTAYVTFRNNYIKSNTYNGSFLGLSGNVNATYYAIIRDNVVAGTIDKSVRLWNNAATTYAVIDTDVIIKSSPSASYKYLYRSSGTATFSGDGTTTQFSIQHNLVSTPSKIMVTPASRDATSQFYITTDSERIYVNYLTAPPAGTNNIVLYWYAEV